jgi:hypothetical protein
VSAKTKRVTYEVQCVHDKSHRFEKVFEIEAGTDAETATEVQIYCPYCKKLVSVRVKGKVLPDSTIYRGVDA